MDTAEEYYYSKKWGNKYWDRKSTSQFRKSEMFDFAEHYHEEKLKEEKVFLSGLKGFISNGRSRNDLKTAVNQRLLKIKLNSEK